MKEKERKRRAAAAAIIVGGATFLAYLGALSGGFVYDDPFLITGNPLVTGKSVTLPALFGTEFFGGGSGASGFYRPLMILLFRAEYALAGPDPFLFHLANVLFHAAAAVMLLFLLRRLALPLLPAACGALFFGLNPTGTESVAWISGGGNPLVLLFGCAATVLILPAAEDAGNPLRRPSLWFALLLFGAALLVKETALVFLVLFFLLFTARFPSREIGRRGRLLCLIPFLIPAGAYVLLRCLAVDPARSKELFFGRGDLLERGLTFLSLVPEYLRLLVWPAHLNIARPVAAVHDPWSPGVAAGALILAAAAILLLWSWRKGHGAVLVGAALFLLSLLSVSTLIPFAYNFREMDFPFFERFLYAPSAGLSCLLAAAVAQGARRLARARRGTRAALRTAAILMGTGVFVLFGAKTILRSRDWRDDMSLYSRGVELYPESPSLHNNLGEALLGAGRLDEAIGAFEKAASLDPAMTAARVNEAIALDEAGDTKKAEAILKEVIAKNPGDYQARDTLGTILAKRGDLLNALPLYAEAYRLSGRAPLFRGNLERLLAQLRARAENLFLAKKRDEAMALAERVIAAAPRTAWAYEVRGILLDDAGRENEAFQALKRAVELSPDSLVAAARLGVIFRRHGMEDEALEMDLYIERGKKRIPGELLKRREEEKRRKGGSSRDGTGGKPGGEERRSPRG